MKHFVLILFSFYLFVGVNAQPFRFALVTDTHVGGSTGTDDLKRTVDDINSQTDIARGSESLDYPYWPGGCSPTNRDASDHSAGGHVSTRTDTVAYTHTHAG